MMTVGHQTIGKNSLTPVSLEMHPHATAMSDRFTQGLRPGEGAMQAFSRNFVRIIPMILTAQFSKRTSRFIQASIDARGSFDRCFSINESEDLRTYVVNLQGESSADYHAIRSHVLFGLFNDGIFTGADPTQRQALIDCFSILPNRYLSSDGGFSGEGEMPGGIDKFPSLISVAAPRLFEDGNRIVPSAMIRNGAFIGKRNIFMFHAAVNLAASIGDDNLIDSHASVGSAAQIGNGNKIGSFVSLEGVLSPANAVPVMIGDKNFLGSFVRLGTGIELGHENFIGAGISLSLGTKLKDCRSTKREEYVTVSDLLPLNRIAILPNQARREVNGVSVFPGEYLLVDNTDDFIKRFEGDGRIRAAQ